MKELLRKTPEGLIPSNTVQIQENNLRILEENHIIEDLLSLTHTTSVENLFHSTINIPRALEVFIILDFEKKRSLICDLLFTVHQTYPAQFSLDQYLFSTKKIFAIITQFRWVKEDTSFILKIIIAYLRNHAPYISTESLLEMIMRFESYGPWSDDDIREIFFHTSCIELIQTQHLMLQTKKYAPVSRKAISQKRKRAQIPFRLYKANTKI
jgi:hypothetical protein